MSQLSVGDIAEDIRCLQVSFVSAKARREKEFDNNSQPYTDTDQSWYDDIQIRLMMQALREGNSLKAQTCLNETVNILETKYPSMLLQRCIWADIANQLLKTSKGINVQIDPKSLQVMMMSVDMHSFRQQMSIILETITAAMNERSEQKNNQMEKEIVNYVQENFYLPQFTITEVAAKYEVSERKIGNIVKLVTGMTYKEFIIKLRIERAKLLLSQENLNVSQTSDSVGYNNVPYFIKTFRNYTGYTPGDYKKLLDKQMLYENF